MEQQQQASPPPAAAAAAADVSTMCGDTRTRARELTCCEALCGLTGILFLCGLFVLICWAIYQPHEIRASVESATLSNLTVSNAAASAAAEVSYNLAVTLRLYNPSENVDIYYDTINAELRFRDAAVLGPAANGTSPAEFYQLRKTRDDVKLEFDYGRGVAVASDVAGELETEVKGGGPVSLDLHVDLRLTYEVKARSSDVKVEQKTRVRCSPSIPVKAEAQGPGVGGAVASGDQCRVKYPRWLE